MENNLGWTMNAEKFTAKKESAEKIRRRLIMDGASLIDEELANRTRPNKFVWDNIALLDVNALFLADVALSYIFEDSVNARATLLSSCRRIGEAASTQSIFKKYMTSVDKTEFEYFTKKIKAQKVYETKKQLTIWDFLSKDDHGDANKSSKPKNARQEEDSLKVFDIGLELACILSDIQYKSQPVFMILDSCRNGRKNKHFRFTEELSAKIELIDQIRIDNFFTNLPTEVVHDWTSINDGGFPDHRTNLIKHINPSIYHNFEVPKECLDTINIIQNTTYRINTRRYDIIKKIYTDKNTEVAAKLGMSVIDVTERLKTLKNENRASSVNHKRIKAGGGSERIMNHFRMKIEANREEIEGLNTLQGKWQQMKLDMRIADEFVNKSFHYVYLLDFRGRMNASTVGLSPQGNKVCKYLLDFDEKKELGEGGWESLLRILAITYDALHEDGTKMSKCTEPEQVVWAMNNLGEISRAGAYPIENINFIEEAGDALEFMSAAMELSAAIKSGDPLTYKSGLIGRLDATNSGGQVFACFLGDKTLAEYCNVIGQGRPKDLYGIVVEHTKVNSDRLLRDRKLNRSIYDMYEEYLTRTVDKRMVMTFSYSVTKNTATKNLVAEWISSGKVPPHCLRQSRKKTREEMLEIAYMSWTSTNEVICPGKKFMDWCRDCIGRILAINKREKIVWLNPLGMQVKQIHYEDERIKLDTWLGKKAYRPQISKDNFSKVCNKSAKNSISPNTVHGADAAVLSWRIGDLHSTGITDLSPIHDSLGTHLCHMSEILPAAQKAYKRLMDMNYLQKMKAFWEERYDVILPEVPISINSFDSEEILSSENIFS